MLLRRLAATTARSRRPLPTSSHLLSTNSSAKHPVPKALLGATNVDAAQYEDLYARSVGADTSDVFWAAEARKRLTWFQDFTRTRDSNFDVREGPIKVEWFGEGKLNVSYNCVDRHVLAGHGDRTALIWEGDDSRGCGCEAAEDRAAVERCDRNGERRDA